MKGSCNRVRQKYPNGPTPAIREKPEAQLDLDPAEAALLDGPPAVVDDLRLAQVKPAAVGVIRLQRRRVGSPLQQAPERHAGVFGDQVPECDVERGEAQVRDAGAADPLRGREVGSHQQNGKNPL